MGRTAFIKGTVYTTVAAFSLLYIPRSGAQAVVPALPDAPGLANAPGTPVPGSYPPAVSAFRSTYALPPGVPPLGGPSLKPPSGEASEPYHWNGLLLQSFAFQSMENGVRIMTANQMDRQHLLNKPFWADYWDSLNQFNMRRWNDGDDFMVNYIGHPTQGAITGYLQIQNDPRGRNLKFSRSRAYWRSRFRALLWSTAFSTSSEISPCFARVTGPPQSQNL